MFFGGFLPSSIKLRPEKKVQSSGRKLILIGFHYFTETMRSKLSVTVYLFFALYGSTTIQSRSFLKKYQKLSVQVENSELS